MKRSKIAYTPTQDFIHAILNWAQNFPYFCYFNPQQTENYPHGTFPHQLALGSKKISFDDKNHFLTLKQYLIENPTHQLFGYFSYDLKNELENLISANSEWISWSPMSFFHAECIITFEKERLVVASENLEYFLEEIRKLQQADTVNPSKVAQNPLQIVAQTSKEEYLQTVEKLQQHIIEGDIYEINYCMDFNAEILDFDPVAAFLSLSKQSPTPFASLFKVEAKYILCASPERFIKLDEGKIISQPIKGTARRSENKQEDQKARQALRESEKERAENMMIVDLVRHDLARSSKSGTVKVEEMFGIYSFSKVHQMISTIVAEAKEDIHSVDIIKNAFPMGSMTGAPKIRATELIEQYETSRRGAFSGSIGYFNGDKNFDFNVVIRSMFYDRSAGKLNYQVGSAITYDSIPEEEYQECLLKALAIQEVLNH